MAARTRTYGTRPDVPDHRDHEFEPKLAARRLPRRVDLRSAMPPIHDQGRLNACSANVLAAAMWFAELREGLDSGSPSRLFIYYNERAHEGLAGTNAPVSLRDGYKSVAKRGACPESMWPYRVRAFRTCPPPRCYAAAWGRRVVSYRRIRREIGRLRACLADGFPFAFAITVYRSFEHAATARTGRIPLPRRGERILGGHAMLAVGYDHAQRQFIVRNSFGAGWGEQGYGTVPYAYLLDPDMAWDFWTARYVSGKRLRSTRAARHR